MVSVMSSLSSSEAFGLFTDPYTELPEPETDIGATSVSAPFNHLSMQHQIMNISPTASMSLSARHLMKKWSCFHHDHHQHDLIHLSLLKKWTKKWMKIVSVAYISAGTVPTRHSIYRGSRRERERLATFSVYHHLLPRTEFVPVARRCPFSQCIKSLTRLDHKDDDYNPEEDAMLGQIDWEEEIPVDEGGGLPCDEELMGLPLDDFLR
jgi:hypothetical protein